VSASCAKTTFRNSRVIEPLRLAAADRVKKLWPMLMSLRPRRFLTMICPNASVPSAAGPSVLGTMMDVTAPTTTLPTVLSSVYA
jgi:hypothetical protein